MSSTHNDSMTEQGAFVHLEVSGTTALRIPNGATNLLVVGSNTPNVTSFVTAVRSGRKLRFFTRADGDPVVFTSGNNISTVGSSVTADDNDSIEFIGVPDVAGVVTFIQVGNTNIVA